MKKILAILLTVCMVVCMIPGAAFANPATNLDNATISISNAGGYYSKADTEVANFTTTYN